MSQWQSGRNALLEPFELAQDGRVEVINEVPKPKQNDGKSREVMNMITVIRKKTDEKL